MSTRLKHDFVWVRNCAKIVVFNKNRIWFLHMIVSREWRNLMLHSCPSVWRFLRLSDSGPSSRSGGNNSPLAAKPFVIHPKNLKKMHEYFHCLSTRNLWNFTHLFWTFYAVFTWEFCLCNSHYVVFTAEILNILNKTQHANITCKCRISNYFAFKVWKTNKNTDKYWIFMTWIKLSMYAMNM